MNMCGEPSCNTPLERKTSEQKGQTHKERQPNLDNSKKGHSIMPLADPEFHHSLLQLESDQPMPSDGHAKGNGTHRKPETDLIVFDEDPPTVPAIQITLSMPGNRENAANQPQEQQHRAYAKNSCIITEPVGELITISPPQ
ncbi:Hypothetical predicted protein [Podarcis lilfordi]|uniref:Uncharacterized protein n=1 Tax=Podarcis lilfordi TaxID=74358 RepID=A0AA35L1A0_9SAUR|nr:Hypothetical predicted protein [Podarcis lilfordi]